MDTQEITRWALGVPLPAAPSRAIGAGHVGRVLVALAQYANADGVAFPAAQTLADDVSGMTRRDVRNALDVLADAGIIEHAEQPRPGRVVRWRLNLAGYPATPRPGGVSRHPSGKPDAGRRQPGGDPGGEPGGVSRHEVEVEEEVEGEENSNVQRFAPHVRDDDDLFGFSEVTSRPSDSAPAARANDDGDENDGPEIDSRPSVAEPRTTVEVASPPRDPDAPRATAEQLAELERQHRARFGHGSWPPVRQRWESLSMAEAEDEIARESEREIA